MNEQQYKVGGRARWAADVVSRNTAGMHSWKAHTPSPRPECVSSACPLSTLFTRQLYETLNIGKSAF